MGSNTKKDAQHRALQTPRSIAESVSQAPAPGSLADIAQFATASPGQRPIIDVDITDYLPTYDPEASGGRRIVLKWQRPSVQKTYQIAKDAASLKLRFSDLPEALASDIATVASCHVGPANFGGTPPGIFYTQLAKSGNDELWYYLLQRLTMAWPDLRGLPSDEMLILDLCLQYLDRHPDECEHLDARVLADLDKYREHKKSMGSTLA